MGIAIGSYHTTGFYAADILAAPESSARSGFVGMYFRTSGKVLDHPTGTGGSDSCSEVWVSGFICRSLCVPFPFCAMFTFLHLLCSMCCLDVLPMIVSHPQCQNEIETGCNAGFLYSTLHRLSVSL